MRSCEGFDVRNPSVLTPYPTPLRNSTAFWYLLVFDDEAWYLTAVPQPLADPHQR